MNDNSSIIMHGEVMYVEGSSNPVQLPDDANAGRIKVKMDSDRDKTVNDLPWAFPLLPKTIQSLPKVGEGVFVLTAKINSNDSQRYYIGPIISQPQFQTYCSYSKGKGDAMSLLTSAKGEKNNPLTAISHSKSITKGSFPEEDDVALVGRGQEDIVLKYKGGDKVFGDTSEIDLRAGIRFDASKSGVNYLKGNVGFNDTNPSYIQLKYKSTGLAGLNKGSGDVLVNKYESPSKRSANSLVNVVGDKINLISLKDTSQAKENLVDNEALLVEDKIDEVMSNLHRAVYGDELVYLLKLIVQALKNHVHHFSTLPPDTVALTEVTNYNIENILSPHVRLS